jgi:hypothetical protein
MKRHLVIALFLYSVGCSALHASTLSGTPQWDINLVKEYCNKEYKIQIADHPRPYPHSGDLSNVTSELRKRVDALVSIYQGFGGVEDIGIVPGSGALRGPEQQKQIYLVCRRLLNGPDGHQLSGLNVGDYVDRQGPDRNCINCRCGNDHVPHPATHTLHSWHEFGLAADFGHFDHGTYRNDSAFVGTQEWAKTVVAACDLGMIPGFWWPGEQNDPAHFEWHPQLDGQSNTLPNPGHALPDNSLHPGYKWKLPDTLYVWRKSKSNEDTNWLQVYDFGKSGDTWITLKSLRTITGKGPDGSWNGTWVSFEPPIKLFPAYIPSISLRRNESSFPEDQQYRGSTHLTMHIYKQVISTNSHYREQKLQEGTWTYKPSITLHNMLIEATKKTAQEDPEKELFAPLRQDYIYTVHANVNGVSGAGGDFQRSWRTEGSNGYTTDGHGVVHGSTSVEPHAYVDFGWNRDTGAVGSPDTVEQVDGAKHHTYSLSANNRNQSDHVMTYSDTLPAGAFDVPQPKQDIPNNPKPPAPHSAPSQPHRWDGWRP